MKGRDKSRTIRGTVVDTWSGYLTRTSPVQPIVNMGQGFFEYNPPDFIINSSREALLKVECNQYAPAKGKPSLKKAVAEQYTHRLGRPIDADTEVTITTGANEGILSALMAFVEMEDEAIVFEPLFDQCISNIGMACAPISNHQVCHRFASKLSTSADHPEGDKDFFMEACPRLATCIP
ncbi:pyridoxal phosphate-dependent transferase [Stachybotrys elegans]|uniref:Pyridoxal phosphate-dependent transferase n=1 Tax=Stachybotrys elegans TaxID=80388 RepID=A0A8K0WM37_9HYPO|nr:pyridoxal phosphate-dependent transferase [Stachybotrys elegans]